MAFDPWATPDTGSDDGFTYELDCLTARFGRTSYNEGQTPLLIIDGIKRYEKQGETVETDGHVWIALPSGWEEADDGTSMVPETGDWNKAVIPAQSKLAHWRNKLQEIGVPIVESGFNPTQAGMYQGWRLKVQQQAQMTKAGKPRTMKDRKTGEERELVWDTPIEYLGRIGEQTTPAATGATGAAGGNGTNGGLTDEQLVEIAVQVKKDGGDHLAFVAAAAKAGAKLTDVRVASEDGAWAKA